jgi:hypothetical protein
MSFLGVVFTCAQDRRPANLQMKQPNVTGRFLPASPIVLDGGKGEDTYDRGWGMEGCI